MILVPLTSIYSPFITILFHCHDTMSTASLSIPVSNKSSSFFPHLVLAFSTMKWFWRLCVHPSSNIVCIPNVSVMSHASSAFFIHSISSTFSRLKTCNVSVVWLASNVSLIHLSWNIPMTIQCFSGVTCFKCFFFYSMVNTSNSLSPSTVSVLLHSARLFFHILWFIKCLVLWYVSTVSVHTSSYTLIDLSASCVLGLSHG